MKYVENRIVVEDMDRGAIWSAAGNRICSQANEKGKEHEGEETYLHRWDSRLILPAVPWLIVWVD